MEKVFIATILILFTIQFALADGHDNWDSFTDEEKKQLENIQEDIANYENIDEFLSEIDDNKKPYQKPKGKFTEDFYIALGIGGIGFLIILYIAYHIFKKPGSEFKRK